MTSMDAAPDDRPSRRHASWRGGVVCIAMFVLGGAVLWGLFLAPRGRSPASPDLPWCVPATPLRFVAVDLAGQVDVSRRIIDRMKAPDADFVLVKSVRFEDVPPLAEALGMARSFHPQLFQRPDPRAKDGPGDLVLSKYPLYDAAPVPGGGVRAVGVVDGVRFIVSCAARATAGEAPTVSYAATGPAAIVADGAWEVLESTSDSPEGSPPIAYAQVRARTVAATTGPTSRATTRAASAPVSTAPSPAR